MLARAGLVGLEQLRTNALRSTLTVLGIVIAVASTITVVSVIQGFTGYVADFLQGFGSNAMWIWPERPEGSAGETLGRIEMSLSDVGAITEGCEAIRHVSPLIRRPAAALRLGDRTARTVLEGVSGEYPAIRNYEIQAGRHFSVIDVEAGHQVCLVGRDVMRKLDVDESLLGRSLIIDGRQFEVVGLLGEKGSFFGLSQDDLVLVPHTAALRLYPSMAGALAAAAQAVSAEAVTEARAQIVNLLRRRHILEPYQPNDFQVRTQDEVLEIFRNISLVASVVLVGIVGISLLVGGIGIMNVMLVSVTERTREIGLRKAVGARRRDILLQFLAEAVALSLLGGGLGIGLGYGLTSLASLHPRMVDVLVPWWAVVLGFGVSAGTGVAFGLLPAANAAALNPIDAPRSE